MKRLPRARWCARLTSEPCWSPHFLGEGLGVAQPRSKQSRDLNSELCHHRRVLSPMQPAQWAHVCVGAACGAGRGQRAASLQWSHPRASLSVGGTSKARSPRASSTGRTVAGPGASLGAASELGGSTKLPILLGQLPVATATPGAAPGPGAPSWAQCWRSGTQAGTGVGRRLRAEAQAIPNAGHSPTAGTGQR